MVDMRFLQMVIYSLVSTYGWGVGTFEKSNLNHTSLENYFLCFIFNKKLNFFFLKQEGASHYIKESLPLTKSGALEK